MKRTRVIFLFTISCLILFCNACKKGEKTAEVRYVFTSNTSANYNFTYSKGNSISLSDVVTVTSWTKTVTVTLEGGTAPTIASVTVFPPATWAGTTSTANINLKIFVNNVQHASDDHVLTASDLSIGFRSLASF